MENTFFKSIIRSSFDFSFYKEIFGQPLGKTIKYLFLLILTVTIIMGIQYSAVFFRFSQKGLKWIEKNLPYIEITEGVVKADVEQPFIKEGEGFVLIIDTTGQTPEVPAKYKTGVLLTKDKVFFKQDEIRTQEFNLGKIKKFQTGKNTFNKLRQFLILVLLPLMIILLFAQFFISKLIQALIAALIVIVFKPGFRFSKIMNICVYALTPVIILSLLVSLAITRPYIYLWFVYIGMYIVFVINGVKQAVTGPEIQSA